MPDVNGQLVRKWLKNASVQNPSQVEHGLSPQAHSWPMKAPSRPDDRGSDQAAAGLRVRIEGASACESLVRVNRSHPDNCHEARQYVANCHRYRVARESIAGQTYIGGCDGRCVGA